MGDGAVADLGIQLTTFLGVEGLADGTYPANIFRVTKYVYFSMTYAITPYCWGRGVPTRGFSACNPNYGMGYTKVSNVTDTGFTLTSYVYKVYKVSGGEIGWFPCQYGQVKWYYTVLGIEDLNPPTVTVTHPNGGEYFQTGQDMLITWDVDDEYLEGTRSHIYLSTDSQSWEIIELNCQVNSNGLGTYLYRIPHSPYRTEEHCRIKVVTYDTNNHGDSDISDDDFTIVYSMKPNDEPIPGQDVSPSPGIPRENFLSAPIPNPFNPQTTIRFGIKELARVSLGIYDVHGRVIKTYYNNSLMMPGEYSEVWDGRNNNGIQVASGIYFLSFKAEDFARTNKIILLR